MYRVIDRLDYMFDGDKDMYFNDLRLALAEYTRRVRKYPHRVVYINNVATGEVIKASNEMVYFLFAHNVIPEIVDDIMDEEYE